MMSNQHLSALKQLALITAAGIFMSSSRSGTKHCIKAGGRPLTELSDHCRSCTVREEHFHNLDLSILAGGHERSGLLPMFVPHASAFALSSAFTRSSRPLVRTKDACTRSEPSVPVGPT